MGIIEFVAVLLGVLVGLSSTILYQIIKDRWVAKEQKEQVRGWPEDRSSPFVDDDKAREIMLRMMNPSRVYPGEDQFDKDGGRGRTLSDTEAGKPDTSSAVDVKHTVDQQFSGDSEEARRPTLVGRLNEKDQHSHKYGKTMSTSEASVRDSEVMLKKAIEEVKLRRSQNKHVDSEAPPPQDDEEAARIETIRREVDKILSKPAVELYEWSDDSESEHGDDVVNQVAPLAPTAKDATLEGLTAYKTDISASGARSTSTYQDQSSAAEQSGDEELSDDLSRSYTGSEHSSGNENEQTEEDKYSDELGAYSEESESEDLSRTTSR